MQLDLIKEVLTGSITGYITNAIAIKMIFREYGLGKLKIGGIVVKTREEFVHNVSSLVEREIINPQTLSSELSKKSFKHSIRSFVNDLLNIHMNEGISNKCLGELEGFDVTLKKIEDYTKKVIDDQLPSIFRTICKNIYLKDLISEKQSQYISKQVFNSALSILESKDFLEKTICDFYNENRSLSFQEIFSNRLVEIVEKNFEKEIKDFHIHLKSNFNEDIEEIFEDTFKLVEIDKILNGLEEQFLEKKIIDFVTSEEGSNLWENIKGKLKYFLQSDDGMVAISNLSEGLLNTLKSIDKPVLNLFSSTLKESVEEFFQDKLQYLVKELVLWIEKNKVDIESLVEDAIEDTIDSIDDDFKRSTLKTIKNKFLKDAAQKFEIVIKITEYLNNNTDIDSISKEIAIIIIGYLKEEKVSNIAKVLENSGIINKESFANYINNIIVKFIDNVSEDSLNAFLNKNIKDIAHIDLYNFFEVYVKKQITTTIKDEFIYTEKLNKVVAKEIGNVLKSINTLNLSDLVIDDIMPSSTNSIKNLIIKEFKDNELSIRNLFCKELNNSIKDLTLNKILDENFTENLANKFKNITLSKVETALKSSSKLELKKIYRKISNIEGFKDKAVDYVQLSLKNNLNYILSGNVKKTVSTNLRSLKDEELQDMVESFMGKEMKPITVIGALLGAVAGVGMYFFNSYTTGYNPLTATAISVIVYGIVGWLTNVQAIAMLFKPYKEKRLFGIKIPFTPGVIVNRKPRFAKSMSKFIDEELLKKNDIEKLFNKNRENILSVLSLAISKKEYKVIGDFLYNYSDSIGEQIHKYIKNVIFNNRVSISNSLTNSFDSSKLYDIDFSKVKDKAEDKILLKIKDCGEKISSKIQNLLRLNNKVIDVIPNQYLSVTKEYLERTIKEVIESNVDNEEIRNKLLLMVSNRYDELVNKSVNEIVNPVELMQFKKYLSCLILSTITAKDIKEKVFNWLQALMEKELTPDKKVDELFDGFLIKTIKDNFDYITNSTVKSIVKGLSNNQQAIAEVAITTTKENLGFFEIMGYNMLGGDRIISSIVHNLVNYKFPDFIEAKKGELQELLENFISSEICGSTIGDLDIRLDRNEVLELMNKFTNSSDNKELLTVNVEEIVNSTFDYITSFTMKEYLKDLSINQFEDLAERFKEESNFIKKELQNNVRLKKEILSKQYADFIFKISKALILSKEIVKLAEGINEDDVKIASEKLVELICSSNSIKDSISSLLERLLEGELKTKNISELVDINEFSNSILSIVESIIEDKEVNGETKIIINYVTKNIIQNNFNILDNNTKKAITDIVVISIVDSLESHFADILGNIDFRKVTEKEINNMEPKEIEDLFNSFAKKYFDRLKLYGFGGAIFGIHWIIGVITAVLYSESEIKNNINNR